MKGRVISVNVSKEKGTKKSNIGSCKIIEGLGLEGDAHAGYLQRHVSLLSKESIEKMREKGIEVNYGDFAENITVEGIDLFSLPVGSRIKIGNDVILKISQIGKECHSGCAIFKAVGECIMPREGIFATVERGGIVSVGDEVEIL